MKNWIILIGMIVMIGMAGSISDASDDRIAKEELLETMDEPNLVVIDVRTGRDWRSSEFKIRGAIRADMSEFDKWAAQLPKDKRYVTYCA